jgi:hypothetical protein
VSIAPAKDPINEAIAAAAQQGADPQMAQFGLQLSTGRPAGLMVPADISDLEWLSLLGGVLKIGDALRAQREPKKPTILRSPALPGLRRR